MNYLFVFAFSFDDDSSRTAAFVLDSGAFTKLMASPESHNDWFGDVADSFEDKFGVVHDFSGTDDGETLIEGFHTYEADPTQAVKITEAWREAFVERLGGVGNVSPIVWDQDILDANGEVDTPSILNDNSVTPTEQFEFVQERVNNMKPSPAKMSP